MFRFLSKLALVCIVFAIGNQTATAQAVNNPAKSPSTLYSKSGHGTGETAGEREDTSVSSPKQFLPLVFATGGRGNQPPKIPTNPVPNDGAGNQSLTVNLSWTGGDLDGNTVTYDVYFGTDNPPSYKSIQPPERYNL